MKRKFKAKYCPKCRDVKMIKLKSGQAEVFVCENCKFKISKSKDFDDDQKSKSKISDIKKKKKI